MPKKRFWISAAHNSGRDGYIAREVEAQSFWEAGVTLARLALEKWGEDSDWRPTSITEQPSDENGPIHRELMLTLEGVAS